MLEELNPTVNFQSSDIGKLPLSPHPRAQEIMTVLEQSFRQHERQREASVGCQTRTKHLEECTIMG